MKRLLWAVLLCLIGAQQALALSPFNSAFNPKYDVTQGGARGRRHGSGGGAATLTCLVTNNGVSPAVCMDFVHTTYTATLTTDTGAHSGSGVTCTGTQSEQFSETFPGTAFMVVVDATYPTGGSSNTYAFSPPSFANPNVYTTTGPILANGSAATSSRTGSVETALYWSGSAWSVSFAGDAVTSGGTTAPITSVQTMAACNSPGLATPLTTPFRSYRRYNGTFTAAQIQTAATQ